MRWRMSNRFDPAGAKLADRHYSRQKPGSPQFVGNATSFVLIAPLSDTPQALWVTKWQRYVRSPMWLNAWVCSLFRNEGAGLSSELITEAVAATRALWGDPPARGFVTFVDADKTKRKRDPGRCYVKAGWTRLPERTPQGLVVLQLKPEDFPEACAPGDMQQPLGLTQRDWRNELSKNVKAA